MSNWRSEEWEWLFLRQGNIIGPVSCQAPSSPLEGMLM
jgi:hypothetical protein